MLLLLTLNIFHTFFLSISLVDLGQLIVSWELITLSSFLTKAIIWLIMFFKLKEFKDFVVVWFWFYEKKCVSDKLVKPGSQPFLLLA